MQKKDARDIAYATLTGAIHDRDAAYTSLEYAKTHFDPKSDELAYARLSYESAQDWFVKCSRLYSVIAGMPTTDTLGHHA